MPGWMGIMDSTDADGYLQQSSLAGETRKCNSSKEDGMQIYANC